MQERYVNLAPSCPSNLKMIVREYYLQESKFECVGRLKECIREKR
jgi:hypothetical protein